MTRLKTAAIPGRGDERFSGHWPRRGDERVLSRRPGLDQLEGRNVVLEALLAGRELEEILLDRGARPLGALLRLLELAEAARVSIHRTPPRELDRSSLTGTHNGVIAWARPQPTVRLKETLAGILGQDERPAFLLLLDQVQYEQNLGAILRTADAAGVHAVILPRSHAAVVSPLVRRISAGASEHLPVLHESPMNALKHLRRAGLLVVGADEHSPTPFDRVDLTGPLVLVLGGEHKGLSKAVRKRCDLLVSLPMRGRIPSLNVSVAAALLMYEKVRQERSSD